MMPRQYGTVCATLLSTGSSTARPAASLKAQVEAGENSPHCRRDSPSCVTGASTPAGAWSPKRRYLPGLIAQHRIPCNVSILGGYVRQQACGRQLPKNTTYPIVEISTVVGDMPRSEGVRASAFRCKFPQEWPSSRTPALPITLRFPPLRETSLARALVRSEVPYRKTVDLHPRHRLSTSSQNLPTGGGSDECSEVPSGSRATPDSATQKASPSPAQQSAGSTAKQSGPKNEEKPGFSGRPRESSPRATDFFTRGELAFLFLFPLSVCCLIILLAWIALKNLCGFSQVREFLAAIRWVLGAGPSPKRAQ